jgi:Icc-related predicted phosphoesterase
MAQTTRLFFATDIHGSDKCFRKFINAAKFYNADVLILGGDITGKMVIPIVDLGEGSYTCSFLGNQLTLTSSQDLANTMKNIRDAGYYPYLSNPTEMSELRAEKEKVDALFERLIVQSIDDWVKFANERLSNSKVKCYISPGNDDTFAIDEHIVETGVVYNPEGKVVDIDGIHEMITLGYSNPTPWDSPREVDEQKLQEMIERMCSDVKDMQNCVFNLHCPPVDTLLDQAPALDSTLRIIKKSGQIQYKSTGSAAVRTAIEKYQPLVGLTGHIHESRGVEMIGKTGCFNPGSEYTEGILRGVLIGLQDKKIKDHLFTAG